MQMGLTVQIRNAYTLNMEMLIRSQAVKAWLFIMGILTGTIVIGSPTYASGSVSIVHNNSQLNVVAPVSNKGSMTVAKDELSITTTNATGYSLYISTNNDTNYLVSEDGDEISPSTSTTDSPAALGLNSWGFAVPSSASHAVISGFSAEYESLIASTDGRPGGLWAAVPVKNDMTIIQKTETSGSYDLDVYFGFNIGYEVKAGTYTGTILYTAIANADMAYDIGEFKISPNRMDALSEGQTISLQAPISPEYDLADIGLAIIKIGGQNCDDVSGHIDYDTLNITCSAPALPVGVYDIDIALIELDGSEHHLDSSYTVALNYDSNNISIYPESIAPNEAGELSIYTTIITEGLSATDLVLSIGENQCPVSNMFYEQGYLTVNCLFPELLETGTYPVTLNIPDYQISFTTNIIVKRHQILTDLTYMQDMTPAICESTPTPIPEALETVSDYYTEDDKVPTANLIDSRDGKQYAVSKLSDGDCWMTQNLRLGADEGIILTPQDSNVEMNFTLPARQTAGSGGWNNEIPHVYDTGNNSLGYLYNWIAVTAGEGLDGDLLTDTVNSICPRGWKLPSMSGEHSYESLLSAYGWTNRSQVEEIIIASPFSFTLTGGYYYGYGGSANGEYWTSTPQLNSTTKALYFKIESLSRRIYTDTSKPRSGGSAIRCIADTEERSE